jgi:hypothetical protein
MKDLIELVHALAWPIVTVTALAAFHGPRLTSSKIWANAPPRREVAENETLQELRITA